MLLEKNKKVKDIYIYTYIYLHIYIHNFIYIYICNIIYIYTLFLTMRLIFEICLTFRRIQFMPLFFCHFQRTLHIWNILLHY